MNTETYNTINYSKPIKIKKNIININNMYTKQNYNEYDYKINNINEISNTDNKNEINIEGYVYEIYDLKEHFFNPDKNSPPNSWKNRLIERIKSVNN